KEQFSSIIDIIISYMDKISLIIPMDNALIDICTKDGIIIHRIGSAAALEQTGYTIGSIINKKELGNNAINKAIDNDEPTIINGEEHFLEVFKTWTCICVPIHDKEGNILVALNVVVPVEQVSPHISGLIMVAARG